MMDIAEDIIEELSQLNEQVHIESVYWQASDEEEFPILLVQDR
ncbi:hypothetical protein J14TS2_41500 [Bacillus sp. J14TS2]|nr:hypothetical protein [Bacillus sp. J14TS2]GIN73675.1 hypothetical protein J14TS2_41500 [Bacillus sp. J14TS2]